MVGAAIFGRDRLAGRFDGDEDRVNGEGRIQRVRKAVDPIGQALPDWEILCRIARHMGVSGFDYKNASDIFREIGELVPEFKNFKKPARKVQSLSMRAQLRTNGAKPARKSKVDGKASFLLSACTVEHVHRGMPLSTWVVTG